MNDRLFVGILIGAIIAWLFLRSSSESHDCGCGGASRAAGAGGTGYAGGVAGGSPCTTGLIPANVIPITFPAPSAVIAPSN